MMGNIHPNDIGLATFKDVGDVEKLKTVAKTIVEAINELYQNGGDITNYIGNQLYVDGQDNIIIGENNVVYGSGNFVIGSNNAIIGNNLCVLFNNSIKYNESVENVFFPNYDTNNNTLSYFVDTGSGDYNGSLPFSAGDKILIDIRKMWTTESWDDYVYINSGFMIGEIAEIQEDLNSILIRGISFSPEAPDTVHIVEGFTSVNFCVPLNKNYCFEGNTNSLSLGGTATGNQSISGNNGKAKGLNSFAANLSSSEGDYSASFGQASVSGNAAFAANYGNVFGECGAAFNNGISYSPQSFSSGYNSRVYGRPLKCTAINSSEKSLVIDSSYSLAGITAGNKIILRCYNEHNSIIYSERKVASVRGNTIYLDTETLGGTNDLAYQLFPDGIIFVVDTSTTYANASQAGGYYSIATGKYTAAHGSYTIAKAEGSNIWGKYGIAEDPYSLVLANGLNHKSLGLAFKVLSDGSVHADKEYTTPCADYAEYFEWEDGNPDDEDRTGYFVKLIGDKIVRCEEFETPLGIVSATPAIIGDSGEFHWKEKYVTDDFGRIQYHDVVIPAEYDADNNMISEEHMERQPILNPEWNNFEEYIPRKNRCEWSPVGVLGKLVVYDDGTLKSGDICRAGKGGIAVKSIENGYRVLKRVAEDKVLVWFKG